MTHLPTAHFAVQILVSHGGKHDVYVHVNGKRHKEAASAASSTCSVTSFFKPQHISRVTEAEARWALFTAKHNLSFLTSDHATKLFKTMFPDSEIAKAFACGHTKTAAIIKKALSPHFQKKTVTNLSNPFSLLVDASLSHETLVHLFSIKFNDTSCCFDTELSEELIAKCKKATRLSLNKK